jgi:predicted Zn-dependent protease
MHWALLVPLLQAGGECPSALRDAQKAFDERKLETATAGFERALVVCAPDPAIHVALAQLLFLSGKEIAAEGRMKAALAIDGKHTGALYALGRLYYEQRRYLEAAAELKRLTDLEPENYKAWDNLGLCYDALSQDSDALRAFFRALDLVMKRHPEYDWAHANLADFFLRREQYEKAFQLASEGARRNPASARNAFLTGRALLKLDKPAISLRWLEQAVKLDAEYAEAWYVLGQTYRKLGREQESDRALERFREANAKPKTRLR